jgi:hypothetical protein
MQGISTRETQASALDVRVVQIADDPITHRRGERIPRVQSPGGLVVTALALMDAAGNKQRAACTRPVNDVDGIVLMALSTYYPVMAA